MNRVEHQKLNQTTAELPFGWVFGVQLGLRQTYALISTTNYFTIIQLLDDGLVISTNQCLYLPKTELNKKNPTKRQLCCCLVEFLVLNSIHKKKRDSPKTLNREEYDIIYGRPERDFSINEPVLHGPVHALQNESKSITTRFSRKVVHFLTSKLS